MIEQKVRFVRVGISQRGLPIYELDNRLVAEQPNLPESFQGIVQIETISEETRKKREENLKKTKW